MTRPTVSAIVLAALAVAVYVGALGNPFVFDDRTEILENDSIVDLRQPAVVLRHNPTRPLTNLSYAVDFAFWERDPFGYHLTNVLLHAVNVLLFFAAARRAVTDLSPGSGPGAGARAWATPFAAAAVFAVHPMMTEAVGYVSGRAEVLCATFFLASLLCFRRSLDVGGGRRAVALAAAAALFLAAAGTKEIAVALPPLLLTYDMLRSRASGDDWRARILTVHLPLLAVVLILGAARVWLYVGIEHPDAAGFDWRNVLVKAHVLERYLALLAIPVSQSIVHAVYPFESVLDARMVPTVAVLGGALAAAVVARRREPLLTFGLVWLFSVLLPSALLILLAQKGQPMAEHRVYLASCGFFLGCAAVVVRFVYAPGARSRNRQAAGLAVLGVLVAVLGAATVARIRVWSDPVRLWGDAARKAPGTWAAQYGAADARREAADCDAALPAYRVAITLRPGEVNGYLGFAECAADLGRHDEAAQALRRAIAVAPGDARPRAALETLGKLRRGPR